MKLFGGKAEQEWQKKYINEYNNMVKEYEEEISRIKKQYEEKLAKKQSEIEKLKFTVDTIQDNRRFLKPRQRQIPEDDIITIKKLRKQGLSYREIERITRWSRATVNRVIAGVYD